MKRRFAHFKNGILAFHDLDERRMMRIVECEAAFQTMMAVRYRSREVQDVVNVSRLNGLSWADTLAEVNLAIEQQDAERSIPYVRPSRRR